MNFWEIQFRMMRSRYRANRRIWNLAVVWVASVTVLNCPWLIAFLSPDLQKDVFNTAFFIEKYGVGLALFWVKDSGTSGNGSVAQPFKKNIGGREVAQP